jgi:hypothetical protein
MARIYPDTGDTDVTLDVGDVEIGAVEIKDGTSDNRQAVGSDGAASVRSVGTARSKSVVRYASSGTGVTTPGTRNIPAGRKSYTVAVIAAASTATPTFDGVALPAGTVIAFSAESGDTLPSATLISVAGDDVLYTEVF